MKELMRAVPIAVVLSAWAALLAGAAPLGAQGLEGTPCGAADSASAAVHDSAYALAGLAAVPGAVLARYACAGSLENGRLSFAVSLPAGWDVEAPDDPGLMIAASLRAPRFVVVGEDPLPDPGTEADPAAFWPLATALAQGREPLDTEVAAFRDLVRDTDGARAAVTRAMEEEPRLLLLPHILSTEEEAVILVDSASEVRALAGRRAGYLRETYRDDGEEWHRETYATIHEARIYAVSFSAPAADFQRLQPLWDRVRESFAIEAGPRDAPAGSR
jgi:hypothetical protein